MKNHKTLVTVLGAGNFGTAVAKVLADNGNAVKIWNWEGDHLPLRQIEKNQENKKYLRGVKLSRKIVPCYKIDEAVRGSQVVFFAIPTGVLENVVSFAVRNIKHNTVLVDLTKGVSPQTLQLIPYVIAKHLNPKYRKNIVSISGPSFGDELARDGSTMMSIASKNKNAMKRVMSVLENDHLKLHPTTDVVGVEIGGSFKNAYAIGMGLLEAMKVPANERAYLITSAISEIADLSHAMGGKRNTAYGLAGLGDLIGTGISKNSRNRKFGYNLGKGMGVKSAMSKVKFTVEGVNASKALYILKNKHRLDLPFAEAIYKCIYSGKEPTTVMRKFLNSMRAKKV